MEAKPEGIISLSGSIIGLAELIRKGHRAGWSTLCRPATLSRAAWTASHLAALLVKALVVCIVPVCAVVLGNVAIFSGQGVDFLLEYGTAYRSNWIWVSSSPSLPLLLAALFVWALSSWYCARRALVSDLHDPRIVEGSTLHAAERWLQLVLPWALGLACLAPLAICAASILITQSDRFFFYEPLPYVLLMLGSAFLVEAALDRKHSPRWLTAAISLAGAALVCGGLWQVANHFRTAPAWIEPRSAWELARPHAAYVACLAGGIWLGVLLQHPAPKTASRLAATIAALALIALGALLFSLGHEGADESRHLVLGRLSGEWAGEAGMVLVLATVGLHALLAWGTMFSPALWRIIGTGKHPSLKRMLPLPLASAAIIAAASWWIARDPVTVGGLFGAIPVVLLAISVYNVFVSYFFVLLPHAVALPSLAALPVLLYLWSAMQIDNHTISDVVPHSPQNAGEALERRELKEHFRAWVQRADRSRKPVFIVAAAGGGTRAAAWTAFNLGLLDDMTCGEFGKRVYAVSGVSGGSLGAALYVSARRDLPPLDLSDAGKCWDVERNFVGGRLGLLSTFFARDSVSPVLASMLFPDLLQRFSWTDWLRHDRGWALEQAWEKNWQAAREERGVRSANPLAQTYLSLYRGERALETPLLLFNSTSVEEGKRVLTSPVRIEPFDGFDLLAPQLVTGNLKLSTAVHNSSRFTYVSPAGLVLQTVGSAPGSALGSEPGAVAPWGRIVDGAYFENSGTVTVRDMAEQLLASGLVKRENLYVVIISNDPRDQDEQLCRTVRRDGRFVREPTGRMAKPPLEGGQFSEMVSPMQTLLATRDARAVISERDLARLVGCDQVFELFLARSEAVRLDRSGKVVGLSRVAGERDAPMGWHLSRATVETMKSALTDGRRSQDQPVQLELQRIAATALEIPRARSGNLQALSAQRKKALCRRSGLEPWECGND